MYKTGDIILFSYRGHSSPIDILSYIIEYTSPLPYSHCGIYLKDPKFLHVSLKGEYVWESIINNEIDQEDDKVKWGIKITPLQEYIKTYEGTISIRKLMQNDRPVNIPENVLSKIQKTVYDKPYDVNPVDWIRELLHLRDRTPQKTNSFWCSAFVGYFLTEIGCLAKDTDWSVLKPCDFAMNDLNCINMYSLGEITMIKR